MSVTRHDGRHGLAAIAIALLAALFFTFTYVFNRAIAIDGGHWAWTASLRYLLTLPMLLPLMRWQGGIAPVWRALRAHPWTWLTCSGLGFVLFYLLLAYAAGSGPSWLVAGSFQFTVIAGMLCAPLIYRGAARGDPRRRIPRAALAVGVLILAGVLLLQLGHAHGRLDRAAWIALACVLGSAVLYPLGNRLLLLHLERSGETLNATQRVLGMTLASQPLWWLVSAFAWSQAGAPSVPQLWLAAGVALTAGVIATILFFQATGMVQHNPVALGAAEAMQAAELLFATLLGVGMLHEPWPRGIALWGALLVVAGIVAFAWVVAHPATPAAGDMRAAQRPRRMSSTVRPLHVDVIGDGPPLVLLHGWAMHGGVFAPLVARLRERHTLHVVDLPGHGRSHASGVPLALDACVDAILAQVPVAPWCGWSLGGMFALHAAATRPQRVPRLAMLCASPSFVRHEDDAGGPWKYGVSAEIFRDFAQGLRSDYRGTLDRFVALEAFGSDHQKDELQALRRDLFARGEPTAQALADGLQLLRTVDLRPVLPGLCVPSLWLAGRRDRLVDPRAMRTASERAPDAQFHLIEHAGHAPFLTHAGDVAAHLLDFLGR